MQKLYYARYSDRLLFITLNFNFIISLMIYLKERNLYFLNYYITFGSQKRENSGKIINK